MGENYEIVNEESDDCQFMSGQPTLFETFSSDEKTDIKDASSIKSLNCGDSIFFVKKLHPNNMEVIEGKFSRVLSLFEVLVFVEENQIPFSLTYYRGFTKREDAETYILKCKVLNDDRFCV